MACVRKRRGKWVVDYRDSAGIRRWVTCDTRREAEAVLEKALAESRNPIIPVVDPDITIKAYSERWLGMIPISLKPRTVESYSDTLRLHLLPRLSAVKVRQLHRGQIKTLLGQKLADGLSRGTVRIIHATLRAMLNAAVEDGVIAANPADKLGRHLKLVQSHDARAIGRVPRRSQQPEGYGDRTSARPAVPAPGPYRDARWRSLCPPMAGP
jgi:hypothetical protein